MLLPITIQQMSLVTQIAECRHPVPCRQYRYVDTYACISALQFPDALKIQDKYVK